MINPKTRRKTHFTKVMLALSSLLLMVIQIDIAAGATDSDGDGLSDFQEIHKYLTNPKEKDTDGDGIPDGGWHERREYTYTVRTILQFLPPLDEDALNDDFQDARVLEIRDDYIELEAIHYPLVDICKSVEGSANWQRDYANMKEYLEPGLTTNWDDKMRGDLLTELKSDGIIINEFTDKQVVEHVSSWLMKKSRSLDKVFTTYYVYFPDEQAVVYPGLEGAFEQEFNRDKENYSWAIDQHFDHEVLGRGMFYNKTYGSCTSFAVYLTTVLRAVGIPTRMIIAIPLIDPSNKDQLVLVQERITHNELRERILAKLRSSGHGFIAHTFNEVYVGNRWYRLNYNELVQSDRRPFGLPTHLYTFNDMSEVNLAPTWGWRYGKSEKSDIFKFDNPYSTIGLSDLFGCHSNIPNPVVHIKEHKQLTIDKAYWFHSNERPGRIPSESAPQDDDGHILFHIDEWFEGEGIGQYKSFYDTVDKRFLLKAEGHPDVRANAERGYWNQEFYLRIPKEEYVKMETGVPYTINPVNSHSKYQWKVNPGVVICKSDVNTAECFDKVWQIINDEFWDPNFNGVDWDDAGKRYKAKALAAKNHESFAIIINRMLGELKTSHTHYYTKWDQGYYGLQAVFKSAVLADVSAGETSVLEQYLLDLRSSQSEPHRSGIGLVTKNIGGRHYVTAVLASLPAEKAGILLGDWVVEVDGQPFHPIRSFENMGGRELGITIQRESSASTRHTLKIIPVDKKERELFENSSRDSVRIIEHKGHRFAYVRLWWLSGLAMQHVIESSLNMAETFEGMIIDIRDGFGGGPPTEYIHHFLKAGLETMTTESIYRDQKYKSTVVFNKPVIVLINGGSRSGKELLAYYFKKTGRAVLIGEQTAGYAVGGRKRQISEDSFLYYAACMIVINGMSLEGVGVEPDIEVPFDIRFAAGKDIQLERAKDEMVKLIEALR